MPKPRISGLAPCATLSCTGRTPVATAGGPGSPFCVRCQELRGTPLDPPVQVGERHIERVLIQEAKVGGGPHTERIKLYGPGECVVCDGPTLRGRLYCSSRCRGAALKGEGRIELDGFLATPLQHAKRLGMSHTTFLMRLRSGASVREALERPLDEEMRRRACG